jgi:hypothetical protein
MLPHDEEGPCAGHRGILFAFLFSFVLSIYLSFLGIWGFLFSNSFFNSFVSGCAIFVSDADPALSSEALGGLHECKQLARALEQAEDHDSARKQNSKGEQAAARK